MMFRSLVTPGAVIEPSETGWRLQIPAGPAGKYRLAQLDNYAGLERRKFPLSTPLSLSLRSRVSSPMISGTWGFGFWNDPFAFSLGLQGSIRWIPELPNACWFFYSSPQNHLSFQNRLPGNGFLAQVFRTPRIPSLLFMPGIVAAPLLYAKPFSRWLRSIVAKVIHEDSKKVTLDNTYWHFYHISWGERQVDFSIDDSLVFHTEISPSAPLGAVIWIDNQFAAWDPGGNIKMGTLAGIESSWLEVDQVELNASK